MTEPGLIQNLISLVLHLDKHLGSMVEACSNHQWRAYAVIFGIVFAETGFVLTPFLPGDSLLFAAGALAGINALKLSYLLVGIFSAAVVGDAVNYAVGAWMGERAMESKWVNVEHIEAANKYFKMFGGKTIILARFIPIVRTFAPFVAGVGSMRYGRFALFNIVGAAIWTICFTCTGYWFGNFPIVKENFGVTVLAIVAISVLPIVVELIQNWRQK